MPRSYPRAWLAILLTLAPNVAGAQGTRAAPKIGQIRINGNHRFPADKIIAASGLRSGQPASQRILEQAASRLAQTGIFSDLSYQFRPRAGVWDAVFEVVEFTNFHPCTFDNFLWFKDSELLAAIAHDVPLFDGALPDGRAMQDQVTAALDRFLHAHQIAGTTTVRPSYERMGSVPTYSLVVTGVPMPVVAVQVTGGPLDPAVITDAAKGIFDHDYSRSTSHALAQTALTGTYQDEGYWKAQFSEPIASMRDPAGKDSSQGVIVTFSVTPGLRYNWAGASWSGTQAMTAEQLNKLVRLSAGEIARRRLTQESWDAARTALGQFGYLTAAVAGTPQFDDTSATVHFDAVITEGPQYRMGELKVDDPSGDIVQAITEAWPLHRGDIYASNAPAEFDKRLRQRGRVPAARNGRRLGVTTSLNTANATVLVVIKYQ